MSACMILVAIYSVSLLGGESQPVSANDASGAPTVSSLEITSDPGDDGVYGYHDHIRVTVTFSEDVVVGGFPTLIMEIGDREARARYESSSGAPS